MDVYDDSMTVLQLATMSRRIASLSGAEKSNWERSKLRMLTYFSVQRLVMSETVRVNRQVELESRAASTCPSSADMISIDNSLAQLSDVEEKNSELAAALEEKNREIARLTKAIAKKQRRIDAFERKNANKHGKKNGHCRSRASTFTRATVELPPAAL